MWKILLWGTGQVAERLWLQCETLNQYELLGFIDNAKKKQGRVFKGLPVYPPEVLDEYKPDKIVILAADYDGIYQQIMEIHPEMKDIIANRYFFYQQSLLKRYKGTTDPEIITVIDYIKDNGLNVFNYEFIEKYKELSIEVCFDHQNDMFYVLHYGKRLYFSKEFQSKKNVIDYYKQILIEQDICSPHRYIANDFDVNEGDVVIDAGTAEGNFSLQIIEKVSKLYIIEANENWIEALRQTFKDYLDKVVFIQKFITSYDEGDFATLDALIYEPVNFIKMDIEGSEWDALQGARNIIEKSSNLKCAVCSYHSDFDQILIEDFMDKHNVEHSTSPGFIWYPWTLRQNYVSTRLNRAIVRGVKCKS